MSISTDASRLALRSLVSIIASSVQVYETAQVPRDIAPVLRVHERAEHDRGRVADTDEEDGGREGRGRAIQAGAWVQQHGNRAMRGVEEDGDPHGRQGGFGVEDGDWAPRERQGTGVMVMHMCG